MQLEKVPAQCTQTFMGQMITFGKLFALSFQMSGQILLKDRREIVVGIEFVLIGDSGKVDRHISILLSELQQYGYMVFSLWSWCLRSMSDNRQTFYQ